MENEILVTVITVAYNSGDTIAKTIESVLNQTYSPIEYLIIDGNSSDNTVSVAESYLDKVPHGKKLRIVSEPDKGMYDALNKGIRLAEGRIIGNINADDWYEEDAVESMVELYQKEPFDLAWADLRIHSRKGSFIKKAKIGRLWTTSHFCHPTMFGTKECETEYPYAVRQMDDDFDMVLRAHNGGKKIIANPKVLANYTLGGMSTRRSFRNMVSRIKMKYGTYRRNGFSRLYFFYCVYIEAAKFILA